MFSNASNSSSAPPPALAEGKPPGSLALVVLTLGLLAALVWAMAPARPKFEPAPLLPVPSGCPKDLPDFVSSDATEIPGFDLSGLAKVPRNHVLFRLNMEPCPCGCNLSIAACLINHPPCSACKELVEKILAEERRGPRVAPGK
jgi:hypothetical protein